MVLFDCVVPLGLVGVAIVYPIAWFVLLSYVILFSVSDVAQRIGREDISHDCPPPPLRSCWAADGRGFFKGGLVRRTQSCVRTDDASDRDGGTRGRRLHTCSVNWHEREDACGPPFDSFGDARRVDCVPFSRDGRVTMDADHGQNRGRRPGSWERYRASFQAALFGRYDHSPSRNVRGKQCVL